MKILITGSTGLTGRAAVEHFTREGWDVIGIDTNMRSRFFGTPEKSGALNVDIRNQGEIEELFEKHKFDAIIHTAAQPSHDYSKDHVLEDFDINARGTVILLEATRKFCPDAVFVHCSTDKIYGDGMKRKNLKELITKYKNGKLKLYRWHSFVPFSENTPLSAPFSPFGVSKLYSDFICQEYAAQGWVKTGIFRMGCITGRNHEGAEQHGFLAYLTKCIKEGKPYYIYGYEGKQVRDQIHANDLVAAFHCFINNPRPGEVYNMGGGPGRSVSVFEAGDKISAKLGKPFISRIVDEPRFGDRQWDIHDVSKFRADYPEWDYKYSLNDIIDDLCAS